MTTKQTLPKVAETWAITVFCERILSCGGKSLASRYNLSAKIIQSSTCYVNGEIIDIPERYAFHAQCRVCKGPIEVKAHVIPTEIRAEIVKLWTS